MRISHGHDRVEEVREEEETLLVAEEEMPLEAEEDLIGQDHHLVIPETEMEEVLKINLIHPSDHLLVTIPMLILQIKDSQL